jgi:hypothetical protein
VAEVCILALVYFLCLNDTGAYKYAARENCAMKFLIAEGVYSFEIY